MNTQDWSPLGWTGWVSLQSKGLSRVFFNTTVPKHQFFSAQLSLYSPALTSIHDYWKNHILELFLLWTGEHGRLQSIGLQRVEGFPCSSIGKESTCNAGDPGFIPGSGRSAGEGIGYPFLYSWASLVAQLVKNLSSIWETWVQSLGWEDSLENGIATHSSILAWKIPSSSNN